MVAAISITMHDRQTGQTDFWFRYCFCCSNFHIQRGPVQAKKSKPNDDAKEPSWQLDNNKRITIREFRGKSFLDIREFYNKDGEMMPGKKGITLSPALWKKLMEHSTEITAAVDAL